MTSSVRLHQAVLLAALAVPAVLFAGAAWQNHADTLREGQDVIERTTSIMQEQARNVLQTAELAVGQVDERIDGQDWATIAAPSTSEFLRRLKAPMDQLVSIWVADAEGTMRAGSQPWPAGTGIGTRDFFLAQKQAPRGTYIGPPFTGLATTTSSFAIIRRRSTPDGHFDGTIHTAVSPAYFQRFYEEASPPLAHTAILLRADGMILARSPPAHTRLSLGAEMPLMQRIERGDSGGIMQDMTTRGVLQDYSFRRVGAYPVYVVFGVPHQVLLGRWYRNLRIYGAVAGAAALTLLAVSVLALRRAIAEQALLARVQHESRQRQAAEEQLRHAQRMDAVGQLTGGVAHDFNNLLTAILGNLELIQRAATNLPAATVTDGVNPQERIIRLAGTATKAVQRGAALTKSLLAFSRKQPLQPRAVDANALLAEFVDLVRQAVGAAIEVTFRPGPAIPPCMADPAELEAAVLNLAINARDAMQHLDRLARLTIETGTTLLDAAALADNPEAKAGRFVTIAVSDNGAGMPPEVAAKAFEPFFTTKPVGRGTGLGLSQVYGFVRQLGGHVTLASIPGDGTTITLHLPATVLATR